MPPPVPPRVKAGRMIAGRPISSRARRAVRSRSSSVAPLTISDGGYGWAIRPGGGGDIEGVGGGGMGHDSRGVVVDKDRPAPRGPRGPTGLRAGVVELGRLSD